jgi:hypothetical protein
MMEEEEEEGGLNMMLIAGVGVLALTGVLIYFKFSGGSDDVAEAEVAEAVAAPAPEKKKPKTIKVEITTDDEEAA